MLRSLITKKLASNLKIYEQDDLPYGEFSNFHKDFLKLQYKRLAAMQNFSNMDKKDLPSNTEFMLAATKIEEDFKNLESYLQDLQLPPEPNASQLAIDNYKALPQKISEKIKDCEEKIRILIKYGDQVDNSKEKIKERGQIYNSFQQDPIFKYLLDDKSSLTRKAIEEIMLNDLTYYLKTLKDKLDADEYKTARAKCRSAFSKLFDPSNKEKLAKMPEPVFKYHVFHLWQVLNSNISSNLDKKQNTQSIVNRLLEENLKLRERATNLSLKLEKLKNSEYAHSELDLKLIDFNLKKAKLLLNELQVIESKILYEPWNHRGTPAQEMDKLKQEKGDYEILLQLANNTFTEIENSQQKIADALLKHGKFALKKVDLEEPQRRAHIRKKPLLKPPPG